MNMKLIGALLGIALLAGCASNSGTTAGTGGAAVSSGPVPGSQEDLVASVGDRVFFAFNTSSLSSEAQGTLERQSGWLAKYPQVSVQVAGNCDDRGTEEYNLALGQRRANSASSRISTISYGKDRPTALGDDEQAWAQNRNAITSVK
jgi:peptidoglycan-associated lipoprotein